MRAIQENEIYRLGGRKQVKLDVRIIAATNKDLDKMVKEHKFREDLYYRLNVVPINIPPLRSRQKDIKPLVYFFLEKFNKKYKRGCYINHNTVQLFLDYNWPGNVRELRNIIERIMILQNLGKVILPENLPAELKTSLQLDTANYMPDFQNTIDFKTTIEKMTNDIRQKILLSALERGKGKKTAAAKLLGISRYTMIRELKKIGKV